MRIAVTSTGTRLDSEVDPRFARACYILIFDSEGILLETVDNRRNVSSVQSPSSHVCKLLVEKRIDLVLTGTCGMTALQALKTAGIKVEFETWGTTVRSAVEHVQVHVTRPDAIRQSIAARVRAEKDQAEHRW